MKKVFGLSDFAKIMQSREMDNCGFLQLLNIVVKDIHISVSSSKRIIINIFYITQYKRRYIDQ